MQFKLSAKSILIFVVALVMVGSIVVARIKSSTVGHTVDQAAVTACQKQVESTYNNLLDTASLVAAATTSALHKQEQDAMTTCVTSNTH